MKSETQSLQVKAFGNVWEPNHTTAQKLSIFLGFLGVDCFYIGDFWLGSLKLLLTISIQGIPLAIVFWVIDIFVIKKHASEWGVG